MSIANVHLPLTLPNVSDVQSGNAQNTSVKKFAGLSFDEVLNSLSQMQGNSDTLMQKLAAGEDVDIPQVMLAAEQTDIGFRVALGVRDRLVEAYKEVIRTQV